MFDAAVWLIREVVYGELDAQQAANLFPPTFHPELRGLLVKVLTSQQASWREGALQSQVTSMYDRATCPKHDAV